MATGLWPSTVCHFISLLVIDKCKLLIICLKFQIVLEVSTISHYILARCTLFLLLEQPKASLLVSNLKLQSGVSSAPRWFNHGWNIIPVGSCCGLQLSLGLMRRQIFLLSICKAGLGGLSWFLLLFKCFYLILSYRGNHTRQSHIQRRFGVQERRVCISDTSRSIHFQRFQPFHSGWLCHGSGWPKWYREIDYCIPSPEAVRSYLRYVLCVALTWQMMLCVLDTPYKQGRLLHWGPVVTLSLM